MAIAYCGQCGAPMTKGEPCPDCNWSETTEAPKPLPPAFRLLKDAGEIDTWVSLKELFEDDPETAAWFAVHKCSTFYSFDEQGTVYRYERIG